MINLSLTGSKIYYTVTICTNEHKSMCRMSGMVTLDAPQAPQEFTDWLKADCLQAYQRNTGETPCSIFIENLIQFWDAERHILVRSLDQEGVKEAATEAAELLAESLTEHFVKPTEPLLNNKEGLGDYTLMIEQVIARLGFTVHGDVDYYKNLLLNGEYGKEIADRIYDDVIKKEAAENPK